VVDGSVAENWVDGEPWSWPLLVSLSALMEREYQRAFRNLSQPSAGKVRGWGATHHRSWRALLNPVTDKSPVWLACAQVAESLFPRYVLVDDFEQRG